MGWPPRTPPRLTCPSLWPCVDRQVHSVPVRSGWAQRAGHQAQPRKGPLCREAHPMCPDRTGPWPGHLNPSQEIRSRRAAVTWGRSIPSWGCCENARGLCPPLRWPREGRWGLGPAVTSQTVGLTGSFRASLHRPHARREVRGQDLGPGAQPRAEHRAAFPAIRAQPCARQWPSARHPCQPAGQEGDTRPAPPHPAAATCAPTAPGSAPDTRASPPGRFPRPLPRSRPRPRPGCAQQPAGPQVGPGLARVGQAGGGGAWALTLGRAGR